jgi:drug/metabolite transporter (DMT)-like permease
MPKFVKSAIIFSLILWILWFYFLFFGLSPKSYKEIFIFLGVLFLAVGMSLSFPFYFIYKKKYKNFTDMGILYKRALKYGFLISFGLIGIALMQAFNIVTVLNVSLFALLYVGVFMQVGGKR